MRTLAVMHIASAGGPPQHLRPWLAALAARGSLEVFVPATGSARRLYEPFATTTVLRYGTLHFPSGPLDLLRMAARFAADVGTFWRHFRRACPDVVVVVTTVVPAALVAARLTRTPAIVYVGEIADKRYVRGRLRTVAGRAVLTLTERLASALVCCSRTVAAQFDASGRRRLIATIYPGVDVNRVSPAPNGGGASSPGRDGGPCLAVVGNITRGRGQDLVIRSLPLVRREFPGARCVIAGLSLGREADEAYRRALVQLADSLGVAEAVTFAGFVDPIADVYACADIVVNPARFNEPFGEVALEALAAGRPVIAARVGAIPEVLTDGEDALLVEPDSPLAIASAVRRLWTDPALRERLVANGRRRVLRDFDQATGVRAFSDLVSAVLGPAGAAGGNSPS